MRERKVESPVILDVETVPMVQYAGPGLPLIEEQEAADAIWDMSEDDARRSTGMSLHDPMRYASLSPPLCRLVAIGMKNPESGRTRICYDASRLHAARDVDVAMALPDALPFLGEATMLRAAFDDLAMFGRLVTFNGRGFDIPVLMHAAARCDVGLPSLILGAAREPRYKSEIHLDLLEAFTLNGAGRRYPLRAYAIGYGLPDPKAKGDGSQVADLVREGTPEAARKLLDYLVGDLETTEKLWRAWERP